MTNVTKKKAKGSSTDAECLVSNAKNQLAKVVIRKLLSKTIFLETQYSSWQMKADNMYFKPSNLQTHFHFFYSEKLNWEI